MTEQYDGWTISFSISRSESDYGQEPFEPEYDFDTSVTAYADLVQSKIEQAFPGAAVNHHFTSYAGVTAFPDETHAYGPESTDSDAEDHVVETVTAILESAFSDMGSWVVAAESANA